MATPSPETVVYKTADSHAIRLDVYRPAGEGRVPVVVWIHGGALIMGNREQIHGRRGLLEACLLKGMALVAIDYRLAPETKLPDILADVHDAFAWVREEGPAHGLDSSRIGVMGHSAGGYLTLMCGFMIQPSPRALVSFYGYGDIAGAWYAEPDAFYNRQPPVSDREAAVAVGTAMLSAPDDATSARRSRAKTRCASARRSHRGAPSNTSAGTGRRRCCCTVRPIPMSRTSNRPRCTPP